MRTLNEQIISALRSGRDLRKLGLPKVGGRVSARGIELPQIVEGGKFLFRGLGITRLRGRFEVKRARWNALDLSNSNLHDAMILGGSICDCVFEGSNCHGLGFWQVAITDCNFRGCDMTSTVMGSLGEDTPVPNTFLRTTFDDADLRDSVHFGECYRQCSFKNSAMRELRFHGTVFEDCVYEGELYDVSFFKRNFKMPEVQENRLKGCDFSKCSLRWVDFRNIDLVDVRLPDNDDHIILRSGPEALRLWAERLRGEENARRRQFVELLADRSGTPGLVNAIDLADNFSQSEIDDLRSLAKA